MKKGLLLVAFLCLPILVFSEEEGIIPYVQPTESIATDVGSKISAEIITVKAEYSDTFLAYDALRENDPSLCGSSRGCKNIVQGGFSVRYSVEGKCDKIDDPASRGHCEDIQNNCNNVSGWKAGFCKAIIANDVNALKDSLSSPDARKEFGGDAPTTDGIAWKLALYSGFRNSNPIPCQDVLANSTLPLIDRIMCPYVFSSNPSIKEQIIKDLAIFKLSKKEKDTKYCDLIQSDLIRLECLKKK